MAYYEAIRAHQWRTSTSFLQPSLRTLLASAPDSDQNNTVSVSHIDVRGSGYSPGVMPSSERAGYNDLREVAVSYDAVYKKVITDESGGQYRFVILGRQNRTGRWTILEIGTGP